MYNFYFNVYTELFQGASSELMTDIAWFAMASAIGTLVAIGVLFFKLFKGR